MKLKKFIIYPGISLIVLCSIGLVRLNHLNNTPIDVDNFSVFNLMEIYTLGIVMSVLAYPIYPEISIEHLSLYSKDKGERESDFFMNSVVVREAINNYQRPTILAWNKSDYFIGNSEARVALALNGALLRVDGNRVIIDVPIRYPKNSLVTLAPGLRVQEGLFWVLQEKGWYHPGTMTWTYPLPSKIR